MTTTPGSHDIDLLVVGGGPGGYAAALHAAHLGRAVTLVDRRGVAGLGGVCLHEGCLPTKALLHVAERAADFRRFEPAGLRASDVSVDLAAFQEWKQALLARLADGVRRLLAAAGVEVVEGRCRFTAADRVAVAGPDGTIEATFHDAVVATGSSPLAPPHLPIDDDVVLDSTAALSLSAVPSSMAVVGGGSVGMELGAAFAKLGTRLTIVEQADEILPMIDPVLVRPLRRRLLRSGVEIITAATVVDHADGRALVRGAGGERTVDAACILAGVGRRPNSSGLGLESTGATITPDGFVRVGEDRRATAHVAAIGDLTPGPFHAHKAAAEARVAVDALCGRPAAFDARALPFIAHADPEVASVGLTMAAAAAAGVDVRSASFPLGGSGWATALDAAYGSANLVVDAGSDVILGVHLVGPHATELIAEGALAVQSGATIEELAHTIHAHPTLSEQLSEAAHVAQGSPLHVIRPRRRA